MSVFFKIVVTLNAPERLVLVPFVINRPDKPGGTILLYLAVRERVGYVTGLSGSREY